MRVTVVMLVCLIACKSKPKADPGVMDSCVPENDNKVVTVDGYLVTPMMTSGCGKTCLTELSDTWEYSSQIKLELIIPAGKGPLTMVAIPPDLYQVDSYYFGLTDSDGTRRPVQSHLRATGVLHLTGNGTVCRMTPTEIHGVAPANKE